MKKEESISDTQHEQEARSMYNWEARKERDKRRKKHQLPDLVGIHSVHSIQGILIEGFQP